MAYYDGFLKTALAKYKNAEFTKNKVGDVLKMFTDLRPTLEPAEFADGSKKAIFHLQGTIPTVHKGVTYNTPIDVWILDTYPFQAPLAYVTPTPSMRISRNDNVDPTGKVHTQYMEDWRHPNSDLLGLLQDMAIEFGDNPPLTSVKDSYRKGTNAEFVAHLQLENYRNVQNTKQEVIDVINVYRDLRPSIEECAFEDGKTKPRLQLEGTIPVIYEGQQYNIPVCIHLMENHPYGIPFVYVKPTAIMKININKHVDETGKVFMPYLSEWKYPHSKLMCLIHHLSRTFGHIPPVFSTSANRQSIGIQTYSVLPGITGSSSNSNDEVPGRQVIVATAPQDLGQVTGRRNTGGPTDENSLASTEDFELHCDPCHADHNFVEAEGFCKECKEYYCKACLRYHGRIASTKNHAVLLNDQMPKP